MATIPNPRWFVSFLLASALLAGNANPVGAQLGVSAFGVGEFHPDSLALLRGRFMVAPRRAGWVPVAGLEAHWLYDRSAGSDVVSVIPSAGLRNNFGSGSFMFEVGYSATSRDIIAPIGATVDTRDGVTNSLAVDHRGSGSIYLQGLASYNYGSESLWSLVRATKRLFLFGSGGGMSGGAEVAYLRGEDFSSVQPGAVLGLELRAGTSIAIGIGRRLGDGNGATYFRAEFVTRPR